MKKRITLLMVVVFTMIVQMLSAAVWRVNNRVNAAANFTTLQAAHDGASNGDTLYVEGSPTDYGALICTKQLHIIGAGGFLNENDSTQAYKEMSTTGKITFNAGSEYSSVEGINILNNRILISTSHITVKRNRIYTYTNANPVVRVGIEIDSDCSDILIEGNWISITHYYAYAQNFAIYSTGVNLTNLVIRNNYIDTFKPSQWVNAYILYITATVLADNVAIYQNIFNSNNSLTSIRIKESQFYNNIAIQGAFTPDGSLYNNNIGNSTQFGTTNGNQENVAASTVFIDPTSGVDSDLKLKAGSSAIGSGLFGEDCGMYGSDHPYKVSLMPSIPAIWDVSLNNYGNDNVTIDVNIKAKSHN